MHVRVEGYVFYPKKYAVKYNIVRLVVFRIRQPLLTGYNDSKLITTINVACYKL